MAHGRPLVGGFSARLSPSLSTAYHNDRGLAALFDLSAGSIGADSLPADLGPDLARSGILHVVVNIDTLTLPLREALSERGLRLIAEAGTRQLYEVVR